MLQHIVFQRDMLKHNLRAGAPAQKSGVVRVPSLKESRLSRGVFPVFFGWFVFIRQILSTPKR